MFEFSLLARTEETEILGGIQFYGQMWLDIPRQISLQALSDVGEGPATVTLALGQKFPQTGFRLKSVQEVKKNGFDDSDFLLPLEEFTLRLTEQSVNRWNMAWRASQAERQFEEENEDYLQYSDQLFTRCPANWPSTRDLNSHAVAIGFGIAALVYGGLHTLAWFAHFKSPVERLLWRISACTVIVGIPLIFFLQWTWTLSGMYRNKIQTPLLQFIGYTIMKPISTLDERWNWDRRHLVLIYVHSILGSLVLLAYGLARAYLVVECFIQLSHMPTGVYETPSWSAYFPHIS